MTNETVTVRMSRSDTSTAWGFRLDGGTDYQRPVSIAGVVTGSLAERAGLQLGDVVTQLCGRSTNTMSHQDVQNTIVSAGNNVDLLVERHGGVRSLHSQSGVSTWKPTQERTSHQQASNINVPLTDSTRSPNTIAGGVENRVSLEHSTPNVAINGHNRAAQPFARPGQYSTSTSQYSEKNKASEYLMHTGGLFGTDPAVQRAHQKQATGVNPATLEAIRLEDESRARSPSLAKPYADGRDESLYQGNEQSASFKRLTTALHAEGNYQRQRSRSPQPMAHGGAPQCDHCGRSILGVFCQAGNKNLHAECFKCTTCGSSLKHTGFFNIDGKLYCDVHAAQRQQSQFGARPPQDPSVFVPHVPPPEPGRNTAPIKASYQPDILKTGPVSQLSPGRPGGISPFQRGVPRMQQGYGADLCREVNTFNQQQTYSHHSSSQQGLRQRPRYAVNIYEVQAPPEVKIWTKIGREHFQKLDKSPKHASPPHAPPPLQTEFLRHAQCHHKPIKLVHETDATIACKHDDSSKLTPSAADKSIKTIEQQSEELVLDVSAGTPPPTPATNVDAVSYQQSLSPKIDMMQRDKETTSLRRLDFDRTIGELESMLKEFNSTTAVRAEQAMIEHTAKLIRQDGFYENQFDDEKSNEAQYESQLDEQAQHVVDSEEIVKKRHELMDEVTSDYFRQQCRETNIDDDLTRKRPRSILKVCSGEHRSVENLDDATLYHNTSINETIATQAQTLDNACDVKQWIMDSDEREQSHELPISDHTQLCSSLCWVRFRLVIQQQCWWKQQLRCVDVH